jgi:5-(carboxyamino)imidazole ribonucleotide synthase
LIAPGSTIGILGGGQLGRMLSMAAAQLGYRVHIYSPEPDSIAAEVSTAFTCAAWDDIEALAAFAADCAVVTYEFENVPIEPLHDMGEVRFFPHPRALETAQDRFSEKTFVEQLGGAIAPIATVDSKADFANAVAKIGTPGILKTRRDGYDGKGQWRVETGGQALKLDLPDQPLIYEAFVRFLGEFSVILCRGKDGEIVFWDTAQNVHVDGILSKSNVPAAPFVQTHVAKARLLAEKVAVALGYVGVLTLEFFATAEGPVFNEMAPRVHNSGHWTIEGAVTSQFENHIRAICGLPLGKTGMAAESVEMYNIIGNGTDDWAKLLSDPANHLHLYGKGAPRPGRKMGHVTKLTL